MTLNGLNWPSAGGTRDQEGPAALPPHHPGWDRAPQAPPYDSVAQNHDRESRIGRTLLVIGFPPALAMAHEGGLAVHPRSL